MKPTWFQVVEFFVIAGPLVAALTYIVSQFFSRERGPEAAPAVTPAIGPYRSRQEWVLDVRAGKPIDDVLEKCDGKVPEVKE